MSRITLARQVRASPHDRIGLSHWYSAGWAAGQCPSTRIAKHVDANNDGRHRDLLPANMGGAVDRHGADVEVSLEVVEKFSRAAKREPSASLPDSI
jgi:hypothetical protein